MSTTLKELAAYVGRSITTVSRALADYDDVSPITKQLVRKAASELGYVPNHVARQLQKQRTDTLALILPSDSLRFSDPFFSELLSGIVERAGEDGFDLLVSAAAQKEDEHKTYLDLVGSRRVDGFVVVRVQRKDNRIDLLRENKVPFVAFGRVEGENDFPIIDEDSEHGIGLLIDHLVEFGHRRIAYMGEPLELAKSFFRYQGYLQGLERHGLSLDSRYVVQGGFRQRSGRLLAQQLLDLDEPPTAIVACNDLLALGAMSIIRELGLTVGKDISVTGFDNILLAEASNPPLTTVHQPAHNMGLQLSDLLIRMIKKESIPDRCRVIQLPIVIRESTGPLGQK